MVTMAEGVAKGADNGDFRSRFYRNGPDHGAGEHIDFVHIRRRFDFCSIEIGRWVTRPERERAAGLFFDALCDLMLILQGPEPLISLRGTLSLQYGIGGRPGVSAHYNPATRCFSLAKNAGPGSIAHELPRLRPLYGRQGDSRGRPRCLCLSRLVE
jgi:hypothetical protein